MRTLLEPRIPDLLHDLEAIATYIAMQIAAGSVFVDGHVSVALPPPPPMPLDCTRESGPGPAASRVILAADPSPTGRK
jgi:hypothetical protein